VRSSRSSAAALAAAIALAAAAPASAHRKDEYLQAARIAIDPGRVRVELDLTPGIAVADDVLRQIDTDHSGTLSDAEMDAYAGGVVRGIALEIDGRPLTARVVERMAPTAEAVRLGEGAIRLQLSAPAPPLGAGAHRLRYRNTHRSDIGVYLANALVPSSDRIAITDQQRDVDQRELRIDYVVRGDAAALRGRWIVPGLIGLAIASAVLWRSGISRRDSGRLRDRTPGAAPT